MTDKRMLIVDNETLEKIDENRGDMNRSEFVNFLISNLLEDNSSSLRNSHSGKDFVEREEFQEFSQGMKELLRNFLDFFISYGMELGEPPRNQTFDELVKKLQVLSSSGGKPKASK
jgi:hypothetical protein